MNTPPEMILFGVYVFGLVLALYIIRMIFPPRKD